MRDQSPEKPAPQPIPVRSHLDRACAVVDAPSIGPKTAARLEQVGISAVADLLDADPAALAGRLDVRHVKPQTIIDWQDQARLVCDVPGLRGSHAQMLVGAGYRSAAAVAAADPQALCAAVLRFAGTADGQRLLRDGPPPEPARIEAWLGHARRATAA